MNNLKNIFVDNWKTSLAAVIIIAGLILFILQIISPADFTALLSAITALGFTLSADAKGDK